MNLTLAVAFIMVVIWFFCVNCKAASEFTNLHRRLRNRPLFRGYAVGNLFGEDEDLLDVNKRQQFDDYGHMRFGKRKLFNDYGHMRFGRNHD